VITCAASMAQSGPSGEIWIYHDLSTTTEKHNFSWPLSTISIRAMASIAIYVCKNQAGYHPEFTGG